MSETATTAEFLAPVAEYFKVLSLLIFELCELVCDRIYINCLISNDQDERLKQPEHSLVHPLK